MTCQDKVAIVTGAAGKGMGRSIALTLARQGAKVVINYRKSEDSAKKIVTHITDNGGKAIAIQADVFDPDQCKKLTQTTLQQFGQIDICIINPGAVWHPSTLDDLDPSTALDDAQAELAPIYNLAPLVIPEMSKRKWGRIIGISLTRPFNSPSYAYNIAKAARTHALLGMKSQAWKNGVTVNIIAPGPVTEIDDLAQAVQLTNHSQPWVNRTNVTPQDIAEGVAFLCSDAASYISGCELPFMFH